MTAKEYLEQAHYLDALIAAQRREIEYWKDLCTNVTGVGFGEHLHKPNQKTEASFVHCLEKIDAIQRRLADEIEGRIALRDEINSRINALSDQEEQLVLRLRYLDGCHWEDIAMALGKKVRTAHRIHRNALQSITVPK